MKALTWQASNTVSVEEVRDPQIQEPTDVVIRVTSTAICGSDLHLYGVLAPFMDEGDIIDHGPMGIVEGVGSAVTHIKPGIGWSSPSTFPASIASCVARACSRSVKPPRSAKTAPARSSSVTRGFTARPYVPSWLALCAHGRSRRL